MFEGRRPCSINSPRRQSRVYGRHNRRKPRRGATMQRFDIFDVGNHLEPLNPGLSSEATDVERLRREVPSIVLVRNMSV